MATLEIRDSAGKVQTCKLSKDQPLSIGSHPANDIQVDDVPGLHSRISWTDDGYEVSAASASDIEVSGRSTRQAPLREGDVLQVGRLAISIRDAAPQPAASNVQPPKEPPAEALPWETIEFECDPRTIEQWERLVEFQLPGMVQNLTKVRTPLPGMQYSYRCAEPFLGKTRLADTHQAGGWKTIIEVRNEVNDDDSPDGPRFDSTKYEHVGGPWVSQMRTLTTVERNVLLRTARWLDERAPAEEFGGAERLAKTFNQQSEWDEILEGWTKLREEAGIAHWSRPGKTSGTSAITNFSNRDLLYVFSLSSPLDDQRSYTKFSAYAHLRYGGDGDAAARELESRGYADEHLRHLRQSLVGQFDGQVDVTSVQKIGAENGTYYLRLSNGSLVKLGGIADVLSHQRCRAAIADQTRVLIPLNEEAWPQTAHSILQSAQVRDVGSTRDDVTAWLKMFVAYCEPFASHSNYAIGTNEWRLQKLATLGKAKGKNGALFDEDGRLLVHFESFAQFVNEIDRHVARGDLKNELALLGFSIIELSADDGGTRQTARLWKSEPNFNIGGPDDGLPV